MNAGRRVAAALCVVSAAFGAAAVTWSLLPARDAAGSGSRVLIGHTSDHLPNASAADWVTYADHVVVVTPVAEREIAPTALEIERGEGLIDRQLTMQVQSVVWSKPGVQTHAPQSFDWRAWGWQFTDGDLANRTAMAGEDEPRLEVGHQYLMAIVWEAARCAEGDPVKPAQWRGLGADAVVPFDKALIGRGEWQGTSRSAAEASADVKAHGPARSLEDALVGRGADALRTALDGARPGHPGAAPTAASCS